MKGGHVPPSGTDYKKLPYAVPHSFSSSTGYMMRLLGLEGGHSHKMGKAWAFNNYMEKSYTLTDAQG